MIVSTSRSNSLLILGAANLISVKSFGEFEFWFSLIKVATILIMIVGGFGLIFFGFGNGGTPTGFANLWEHGGSLQVAGQDSFLLCHLLLGHIKVSN